MRLYDEPPPSSAALSPGSRVPTAALTHALAEIEARRARQAFEQAGTVTLAEALSESGVEATPEELAEEVERVREADSAEAAKQKRRRRLRLILRAEIVSVLACGLTLLSLSRTVYNPQWQASHRADGFKDTLPLTLGPHPRYTISVVPTAFQRATAAGSIAVSGGGWSRAPAYPLSALPDGYNIHHYEGLDDEGRVSFGDAPLMPSFPAYFEFREAQKPSVRESVSVLYNGLCYRRGWIRISDVPSLVGGRPFFFYPEPVDDPQDNHKGLVPLTLPSQNIVEARPELISASGTGYRYFAFAAGAPQPLDEHAWEKY